MLYGDAFDSKGHVDPNLSRVLFGLYRSHQAEVEGETCFDGLHLDEGAGLAVLVFHLGAMGDGGEVVVKQFERLDGYALGVQREAESDKEQKK